MKKILITGSNSFIGRNYILYSKYRNVDEISLLDHKPEEIDFSKYNIVIHLAAIVHQSKKISENKYFEINRDLCLRVARCAKESNISQFIFLSTIKVYGNRISDTKPLNEDSLCKPKDSYGKSKLEAELGLKQLENDKFCVSIIRTPLVYGEGIKANMLSILKLVNRFCVLPFGKVNNRRSFTYVENMVGFIDRIIEIKASGTFIGMDENPISTTDLINYISKYLPKKVYLFRIPKPLMNLTEFAFPSIYYRLFGSLEFGNSKTLEILDFKPAFTTEEGIKRMVLAFKKGKNAKYIKIN